MTWQAIYGRLYKADLATLMKRHAAAAGAGAAAPAATPETHVIDPDDSDSDEVGRCRLTVSKPVLKAPMVSVLEATIL